VNTHAYIPTVVHAVFNTCMPVLHWFWLLMCCGLVLGRSVFSSMATDVYILAVIYSELLEICALFRFHRSCWQAAGVLVSKQRCETAAVWKRWISCETHHWHCMNMLLTYTVFQRKFTYLCLYRSWNGTGGIRHYGLSICVCVCVCDRILKVC